MSTLAYVASTQKRAFLVAPKKALDHWIEEAESAFPKYFRGTTVKLGAHIKPHEQNELDGLVQAVRLVGVNYESLERFFPLIEPAAFDTIIIDESHYIKNPKAKRTQFLLDNRDMFDHRLLLSGTPIKNKVDEFVSQLEFLGMENAQAVKEMEAGKLWNTLHQEKIFLKRNQRQ